jgi:ribosomal 30S subunit maturation factor RimM
LLIPVLKDIVLDINIETKTVIIKNVEKWQWK